MSSTKNILYGGYEGTDKEICKNVESLGEALLNKLKGDGQSVVLVDGISGRKFSGNDLLSKAVHLAQYLQQTLCIRPGDVISVVSENRIEFVITIHATLFIGATLAPLNHSYTEYELNHGINLSKPKIIFVSPPYFQKVCAVAQNHKCIEQLILYDNASSNVNGQLSFTKIMDATVQLKLNEFKCQPQNMKNNVAIILCSSGTTGLPKGVQLTQFNMFVANMHYHDRQQRLEMPASGERIVLGNLPMYHAFGMCIFITTTLGEKFKLILLPRYTEESFLHSIQTYKVTTLYLVPPIMVFLAKSPMITKYDLSSLHVIWCGAAPLSKDVETVAKRRTGVKLIRQGYGMTEATFAVVCQDDFHHTNGSVGVLHKGVYGRVVDVDSGEICGPNRTGELHFKSACIMKGYIGNPEATSTTIDANGWLHTGDIGYYDENGEWYIVDRIKELIKYKAFQVPPAEIEAVLLTHPQIKDAGVIGVPDEECGEKAFAFIVKQPAANINENDVIQYIAERLSNPKRLHGGVKFIDIIPKSTTGKILRDFYVIW